MAPFKAATGTSDDKALFQFWSDDPAEVDPLSFSAISQTVVEALLDDDLDPLANGLSGSWGGGKTTVLRLIERELNQVSNPESSVPVVSSDPWRYDPLTGAKETLISEVLGVLKRHLETARRARSQTAFAEKLGDGDLLAAWPTLTVQEKRRFDARPAPTGDPHPC